MCLNPEFLKLCTCDPGQDLKSGSHWILRRESAHPDVPLPWNPHQTSGPRLVVGVIALPSEEIMERMGAELDDLTRILNEKSRFDFEFTPEEEDILELCFLRNGNFEVYDFFYEAGAWVGNGYSGLGEDPNPADPYLFGPMRSE